MLFVAYTAIRSGDYYMFNNEDDNIGMIDDEEDKEDDEEVANKRHSSGVTISEVSSDNDGTINQHGKNCLINQYSFLEFLLVDEHCIENRGCCCCCYKETFLPSKSVSCIGGGRR